ncbi:MAG: hypothetical protein R3236_10325 [Phycisphaeraceae bacterium]|nr:hypothetical protein [Phycisphaeraceae bacterium]
MGGTRRVVLVVAGCVGVGVGVLAALGGVAVQKDKENVVASRLIGTWKTDAALSKRLRGRAMPVEKIMFTEDAAVAEKVPDRYAKRFKEQKKRVYLSGTMVQGDKVYPFLLIEHNGNPHLLYFREKNGDPMGDGESFNLSIARAADKKDDILFIGGDFNNQPFTAYKRVE